jgi:hypothetical protein
VRFLKTARAPVVVEPGTEPIPLTAGSYEILEESGRLTLQAWTSDRNFVRRITGVGAEDLARLDLTVERFGRRTGLIQLLDTRRATGEKLTRKAGRLTFRETFRRMLSRQFPRWKLVELSSEQDLQHSLSGACTRAFLRLGGIGQAAVGAAPGGDVDGALTAGLIWLDYLRGREPRTAIEALTLFVPAGAERTICHRIRHLRRDVAAFSVFTVRDGWEHPVDIADAGNIETRLVDRARMATVPSWLQPVQDVPGVETVECGEGYSFRVNGLEFARSAGGKVWFGLASRQAARRSNAAEVIALATELAHMRSAASAGSQLGLAAPERWLESMIRRHLVDVDAGLLPAPVYGQAPTISSGERGVIDLLAVGIDGRLTVVEVKASEDLNLPLQALDYWARVKWHLDQGDFTRSGYFSGVGLSARPPRMLLVAPALQFHPTTETILRFFPPDLEVERIGVSSNWRSRLKVVFRARGCDPVAV